MVSSFQLNTEYDRHYEKESNEYNLSRLESVRNFYLKMRISYIKILLELLHIRELDDENSFDDDEEYDRTASKKVLTYKLVAENVLDKLFRR